MRRKTHKPAYNLLYIKIHIKDIYNQVWKNHTSKSSTNFVCVKGKGSRVPTMQTNKWIYHCSFKYLMLTSSRRFCENCFIEQGNVSVLEMSNSRISSTRLLRILQHFASLAFSNAKQKGQAWGKRLSSKVSTFWLFRNSSKQKGGRTRKKENLRRLHPSSVWQWFGYRKENSENKIAWNCNQNFSGA